MTRVRDHFEVKAADIVRRAVIVTFVQVKVGYKGEQKSFEDPVAGEYEAWAMDNRSFDEDSMERDEYRASVLQALRTIGFCLLE